VNKKVLALLAMAVVAPAWSADAPPAATPAAPPTADQVVEQFRSDLQSKRADIMAKGLTLTSDQAAKFWPLYEQFQNEQNAIVDEQLKAIQKYAAGYATLTDADAETYIKALLERDIKMQQLRVTWLAKFQKVVGTKIAARAIQVERRLGLVTQVKLSSQIPLIR
jgi:Spy/CpxP family protein refolding chaperone